MQIKEIDVKSVMTKSNLPVSDYSVNPYVGCSHACKYCYASFMKRFTNHPEPWGEFVDVKNWPEIKRPEKYAGKEAFFGSVTDCYQPCEAKYKRTRTLLEQLQGSGISISIATKSDLAPIFPGITDPIEIIEQAKKQCNLVWLENLNLRGDYRVRILEWIHEHHPELDDLYHEIYSKKSRAYWTELDEKIREYTARESMPYMRDDDQHRSEFGDPPVVVN